MLQSTAADTILPMVFIGLASGAAIYVVPEDLLFESWFSKAVVT